MLTTPEFSAAAKQYNSLYDRNKEVYASRVRREFIRAFPMNSLNRLKLEQYIIGQRSPTFCNHLEVRTNAWANIHGSTAAKFGIYFGRKMDDQRKKYRFAKKIWC